MFVCQSGKFVSWLIFPAFRSSILLNNCEAMLFVFKNKLIAFWQVLNAEQHEAAKRNEYNFDHPGKNNKILNFQFYQWRELQSNVHYWTVL